MPLTASDTRVSPVLLATLIAIAMACDFLMMPALTEVPLLPILVFPLLLAAVGSVLAQGCLLAAWMAWSDQPFWQRLTRHWMVAAMLYLAWAAGLAIGQPSQFPQISAMVGLSVPLMSVAAQLPLWIVRQMFGWRLIRADENDDTRRAHLSIRDLMLATVVVAVALALARWAPSPDGKPIGVLWVIMFLAATTVSTITLLPVSPPLLRAEPFHRGIWFAGFYAAFWMGLPWLIVVVGWSRGLLAPPPVAVLVGLSCLVLSFAATVIFAAAIARSHGYRLDCRRPTKLVTQRRYPPPQRWP